LTGRYSPIIRSGNQPNPSANNANEQESDAKQLLEAYCQRLYQRYGTYEKVARISGLDRRTVKKHICAEK
jgi:DNA invertase Pin-like site-specific DNA recombinase